MISKIKILNKIDDEYIFDGEELDQSKKMIIENDVHEPTFMYLGKPTKKLHFRAFVYNKEGEQKICNNYQSFKKELETSEWFESIEAAIAYDSENSKQEEKVEKQKRQYNRKPKEEQKDLPIIEEEAGEVIEYGADR